MKRELLLIREVTRLPLTGKQLSAVCQLLSRNLHHWRMCHPGRLAFHRWGEPESLISLSPALEELDILQNPQQRSEVGTGLYICSQWRRGRQVLCHPRRYTLTSPATSTTTKQRTARNVSSRLKKRFLVHIASYTNSFNSTQKSWLIQGTTTTTQYKLYLSWI